MSTGSPGFDGFQRRHAVFGFPIAVVYKFGDDQGNYLAATMTYYGFIAIFPLLLIATSILGWLLQGNQDLEHDIINSALSQFPVIGDELEQPEGLSGSVLAVTVSFLVALYGSLGVAQAGQNAINIAWAVPRNSRPNPIMSRLKSVLLLLIAGLALLATAVAGAFARNSEALGIRLDKLPDWWITLGATLLTAAIFTALFRLASAYDHRFRTAAPGAIVVAVLLQVLQRVGEVYVQEVLQGASSMNGTFALVLGLVGLLYAGSFIIVFGLEVNVVRAKRLYPRALLTPFTDNVDLTEADRRAYAGYVKAQRHKGYQVVDVHFGQPTPRPPKPKAEPVESNGFPEDPDGEEPR